MGLTKEQRDAMSDDMFAFPRLRKCPLDDETHIRLAWDMVDQTRGATQEERRGARERILHRAHEIGVSTKGWQVEASIEFQAMAIEMPAVDGHPNRLPFRGVLTRVDELSDKAPHGSNGRRVFIPSDVAEAALPSILGMAVDYTKDLDGHDKKSKIGLITGANVVGNAVEIEGFFYAADFPEEVALIQAEKDSLGFSYEARTRIQDLEADPWVVTECVFTGAAVLYKDLAAYETTSLAAQADQQESEMDKETLDKLMADIKTLSASVAVIGEKVSKIEAKGASLGGPIVDQVKPHVEACNAAADAMEAAGIGTHASNGHVRHLRHMAAHLAAEAVAGKVPHIYRDHDYLSDARVEAGADKTQPVVDPELSKQVKDLAASVESIGTVLKDLQAKAFTNAPEPERKTMTPEIKTLLAKANIAETDVKDGKLSVEQVDKVLDASGMRGTKALEFKLNLREKGLMQVATR